MKNTEGGIQDAWMLALIQQWKRHEDHQHQPDWWTNPRQITAQAGTFDAPTWSTNDPGYQAAQTLAVFVFFYAIYFANMLNPRAISCKSSNHPTTPQTRAIAAFPAFFVFLSLCQMIHPPTHSSSRNP